MISKGLISALSNIKDFKDAAPLDYSYEQFSKDCDQIFSHVPKGKRLIECMRCRDVVTVGGGCSCGYIGEIVKNLKEKQGENQ